jgi:CHAT domain-containing protein/TolA-binding protein
LADLQALAQSVNDAPTWSDLAVADYETALRYDAPEMLAEALAACDHALALDSSLQEALFNRALMIERLGLRDDAYAAWQRFIVQATPGPWEDEARRHIESLTPEVPFLQLADRTRNLNELVQRDPQSARTSAEAKILGRWGLALLRGDAANADRSLRLTREIAADLAHVNSDRVLKRSVAAIDGADPSVRALLASAHVDYDNGLTAFRQNRPVEAEPLLQAAATHFEEGHSPMASCARYYAANTAFEQGRHDEAQRDLESLLSSLPSGFDALRAEILWELGVCHATRADWSKAMGALDESIGIFEHLHETQHAAAVRRIMIVIYERTGDTESAWKTRMLALRGIGVRSDLALEKALASIAESAMLQRNWPTAVSFLSLQVDVARRLRDDVQLADALLKRAEAHSRLHEASLATADIGHAEAAIARTSDPAYRDYFRVAQVQVKALTSPASKAKASLTEAIEYHAGKGTRIYLPTLYLLRARAFRELGDVADARSDLQRGIAEIENHRASLPRGEARWGAFHGEEELFEEAIDLALDQNDAASAFEYSERARARALLESYGLTDSLNLQSLSVDTVIVEYAELPSQLVIFTARASGVSAVKVPCDRAALAAEVDTLSRFLRSNHVNPARAASAALHRRLLDPVAARLLGARTIVVVPDATTAIVPFSALIDSSAKYLIEEHAVVIAPSAAVFCAAAARDRHVAPQSVLVIASPGSESKRLAFVDDETRQVADAYRHVVRQNGDANIGEIVKTAVDVIHFAGHAVGDDTGLEPASLLFREKGEERRVGVKEIAHLRLPRASIVILAGCGTARGERRASEGVISLAHGFLTAGARSVVATLWPIDDEAAALFFPRLHQRLSEGLAPADAVRAVQIDSIRRGDVPPSLWAAIQDIGS